MVRREDYARAVVPAALADVLGAVAVEAVREAAEGTGEDAAVGGAVVGLQDPGGYVVVELARDAATAYEESAVGSARGAAGVALLGCAVEEFDFVSGVCQFECHSWR